MRKTRKGAANKTTEIDRNPIIPAYSVPADRPIPKRDLSRSWLIFCPNCGGIHAHGQGDGPREPHCAGRHTGTPGYSLKYAGPLPPHLWIVAKQLNAQPPKPLVDPHARRSVLSFTDEELRVHKEKKRGGV